MARLLDNWLKTYMQYSSYSEAPDKMHFWVGVSTIAAALRRCVWIDMGYFKWLPNFYIILVAPPGVVSKSTTMSIGMNIARQIGAVKFGPDSVTWPALTQALSEANELVDFGEAGFLGVSAITIAASEFGTFLNPNDEGMINVLVDLWDGKEGVWEKRTKTQGSDKVENPWINICACTTPAWIAGSFPQYLVGGGFTSRCIFVFAQHKRRLVAYPSVVLPDEFNEQREKLVQDLEKISLLRGAYTLDTQAVKWGTTWYEHLHNNRPKHLDNERFAGYIARKQTHVHKLAMVLSAAEKDELVITEANLSAAAEIVSALESDMPHVFGMIGMNGAAKQSNEVAMLVRAYGTITQTALFGLCFKSMSYREFQEALVACMQSRAIDCSQKGADIIVTYIPPTIN